MYVIFLGRSLEFTWSGMARLSSLFLLGPDQCGAEREFSQLIRKSLGAIKRESSLKNNKPPMNRGPGRWRYNYIFYLWSSVDSGMLKRGGGGCQSQTGREAFTLTND